MVRGGGYPTTQIGYPLIDGRYAASLLYWTAANWLVFDFGDPRVIDEAIWYQSSAVATHGVWKWTGWNGAEWEDIGPHFTLGGSTNQVLNALHGNTKAYSAYSLDRVSGIPSSAPWLMGVDFRIDDNSHNPISWTHPQSSGDRVGLIDFSYSPPFVGISNPNGAIDGNIFNSTVPALSITNGSYAWPSAAPNPQMTFDFRNPVVMQAAKFRMSGRETQGTWVFEASNDGVSFATVSPPFVWGGDNASIGVATGLANQTVDFSTNVTAFRYYRLRQISGATNTLPWQQEITFRLGGDITPPSVVSPIAGSLILTGSVPEVLAAIEVDPLNGGLVLTGEYPTVHTETIVEPSSGSLVVSGSVPTIRVGSYVTPSTGDLELSGLYPIVYTLKAVISSQIPVMMLAEPEAPPARSSQISVSALAEPVAPPVKSSQTPIAVLGEPIAPVRSSQNMVAILAHGSPCTTQRCQIWTIHRRDGKIFRFTSHDEEVKRGPAVYLPCKSLNPTAAENASTLGSVGNIELTGIIDHDSITEADLYGGLFDDAFVTVDLYSWGDRRVSPRRLAAGWTGSIGTGDTGFTLEILGPGSRLEQQALVQMITPSCRWIFGSPQCGVNIEAMKVPSVVVKAHSRGSMRLDLPAEPTGRQWSNGRIRFITGPNAGITVETKTVDFTSGEVVLWQSPGFLPEPGDEVEILPGCDFNRDGGCKVYNNVINFGGFPDVPGSDALLETPDAKY